MKGIYLILLVFSLSCCGAPGDYEKHQRKEEAIFHKACVKHFKSLYSGAKVQPGNWMQKREWRRRLYKVDGRIFVCKETRWLDPHSVGVHPVEFQGE